MLAKMSAQLLNEAAPQHIPIEVKEGGVCDALMRLQRLMGMVFDRTLAARERDVDVDGTVRERESKICENCQNMTETTRGRHKLTTM